jgi:hypothetical protein
MQQACHKMEIGGVADRRLRLVRHQFDAVCLHHANIDRAAAGYSPDVILLPTGRNGAVRSAYSLWWVRY